MKEVVCCVCGVHFFLEDRIKESLLKTHKSFYCPNGHVQHYVEESEEQKRIEKLERDLRLERETIRYLERSIAAYKGQITKLKKKLRGTEINPRLKKQIGEKV